MTLYFVTEARFYKYNLHYYTEGSFTSKLWERYLDTFDSIKVVARVLEIESSSPLDEGMRSDMNNVEFLSLPYYIGPIGYIERYYQIRKIMKGEFKIGNAFILRVPGTLGTMASKILKKKGISYAVEVVGDPYDVFNKKNIINKFFQITGCYNLRKTIRNADSSLYVTKEVLQRRYPPRMGSFTTSASNVILKDDLLVSNQDYVINKPIKLLSIGMLAQMYKAPDIVLKAIRILTDKGIDINLKWLGDGLYRTKMQELARELSIEDKVLFMGTIPAGPRVIKEIDDCDIFILVSRTEGLPRALIEAMSRGKYCIATKVGGVPELLDEKWLIEPNSVSQLVQSIINVIENPKLISTQVAENLSKVSNYTESILQEKRHQFYMNIIQNSTNNK